MNFKVQDEAQYFLDGLTIKHVHYQTGTPAFLIQHCYGTKYPKERHYNKLPAVPKGTWILKRPKQKNECARSINPIKTMEEVHRKTSMHIRRRKGY